MAPVDKPTPHEKRTKVGRGADQFVVRLPEGMRDKIAAAAEARGRSMNSEIVDRLLKSMEQSDDVKELQRVIGDLLEKVERLENKVYEPGEIVKVRTVFKKSRFEDNDGTAHLSEAPKGRKRANKDRPNTSR